MILLINNNIVNQKYQNLLLRLHKLTHHLVLAFPLFYAIFSSNLLFINYNHPTLEIKIHPLQVAVILKILWWLTFDIVTIENEDFSCIVTTILHNIETLKS